MALRLDDCSHCACATHLSGFTRESAVRALEAGELGCDNCEDDEDGDGTGHTTCVVLYDEDEIVWDGRCKK
jgi:hypothetical protein